MTGPVWLRAPFTVLDGGLSTALEELGERPSGPLWTAEALLDRPEVLEEAHRRFVDAGADVVITASYQASVPGFVAAGLDASAARRLLGSTTAVARASGASVVAASVGPYGAVLADGSEYRGVYDASWSEVRALHRERLEVLVDSGPDVFAVETMPTVAEAEIVVDELRRLTDAPAWVSFCCRDADHTFGGDRFADAAAAVAGAVDAVGVNCTAPLHVAGLLAQAPGGMPLVAYPNHGGTWDAEHRCWAFPGGAGSLGEWLTGLVPQWLHAGARLIGGCCGVGSDGIRALAASRGSVA